MSRLFDALESIEKRKNQKGISGESTPFASSRNTSTGGKGRVFLLLSACILCLVTAIGAGTIYFLKISAENNTGLNGQGAASGSQAPLLSSPITAETIKNEVAPPSPPKKLPSMTVGQTSASETDDQPGKKQHLGSRGQTHITPYFPKAHTTEKQNRKAAKILPGPKQEQNRGKARAKAPAPDIPLAGKGKGIFSPETKRLLQQAEELRDAGNIDDAERIYEKLWKQTRNPLIANNLAACLILSGKLKRAEQILEKALKLNPDDPDLRYNLKILKGKKF